MALLMSSSVSAPRWRTPASVPWSFSESESNISRKTLSAVELDLLVIGSGPGGQKAAIQAAKLGKRVAVAERRNHLGGVSIHTGTIPSKTLRQAVLEQLATRPLDVLDPTRVEETERQAIQQLLDRAAAVVAAETAITREQFRRNHVGMLPGDAVFEDDHTIHIDGAEEPIRAGRIVVAVGTRPARPSTVEFDDRTIIDSDGLLKLESRVPRTMTVVGGGRDRRRVRVDVRRARDEGDRRRPARPRAVVPRHRDRRGVPVPAAPQQRDVPAAREGRRRRGAQGPRRAAEARLRQGDRVRDRALRHRPPGRHGEPRAGDDGPGDRQARAHQGRRDLPDRRPAHLRRRRLRGRSRAGGDGDGAGPDRRPARVRSAGQPAPRPDPDAASTRSPSWPWWAAPRRS